jgi:hypothetical protein
MGGRVRETLVGALWAMLVGAATGLAASEADVVQQASACLVAGGLTGATFPMLYRVLTATCLRLLRACLRHAAPRPA